MFAAWIWLLNPWLEQCVHSACAIVCTFLHVIVIMQMVLMILCNIYFLMFFLLRIAVYILWQITQGCKDLIVQLRRQIVNVSKTCFCVFLYLCTVPILWFFINSYCCFPSLSSSVLSLIFSHQEGKDKSFLLDKLQKLQKPNKKPAQNNQKRVCCRIFEQIKLHFDICYPTHLTDLFSSCLLAHPQSLQWPLLGQ